MGANESKTGFVAEASLYKNEGFQPYMAFASHLEEQEWATNSQRNLAGEYLQIKMPAAVKIWKIRVRGRSITNQRITSWTLSGAKRIDSFVTLLTASPADIPDGGVVMGSTYIKNATIDSHIREFEVVSSKAYSIYRITITASEEMYPGISLSNIH